MTAEAGDVRKPKLRFASGSYSSTPDLVEQLAESIGRQLACDGVVVTLIRDGQKFTSSFPKLAARAGTFSDPLFDLENGVISFRGQSWSLPFVVKDLQRARLPHEFGLELTVRKVRSFGAFPLIAKGRLLGVVECYFTRSYHRWHAEELVAFEELSKDLSSNDRSSVFAASRERKSSSEDVRSQYSRMARYGNIIIIITDDQFRITDVFGNTESTLGIPSGEMKNNPAIWERIIDPRDQAMLRRKILRLRLERSELREEIRVLHPLTSEVRWMMLRALPQFSPSGAFLGWEGFGIDITDRRLTQDALVEQSARVEALLEVARALQGQTDPARVVLRGLRAVMRATRSVCGYGCFYHSERDEVEVVAAEGLSERYLDHMEGVLKGPSLLRQAIATKKGRLVADIQKESLAHQPLSKIAAVHSAIVVPLTADEVVYGALVIFTKEVGSYSEGDFELVNAAATQIALSVRQAHMLESERFHSQSLAALYRVSHELAKYRTPREIAEHAFPIFQQEFTLKRGWFGIMSEQGTHIVGKAGFGPGIRRKLQEVQIELALRHDFFDDAIRSREPVVVEAGQKMECSGLQRAVESLKLGTFVVVPLVSLQQVVGVLVFEPTIPHSVVRPHRLQLLASMASEMATVVMARSFESKMADALKMRMAGLLASGVAHNFNNMLQAILGQVSLLEMQIPKTSPAIESVRMVGDAAKRGASLVSQLINFTAQGVGRRQSVNINKFFADSLDLYRSLLGKRIQLTVKPCAECSEVPMDQGQIQQVITNILVNSKEALEGRDDAVVEIMLSEVTLRSGEIDPELAPGRYVRIDVMDNGVGMTQEQQVRCFEPFYTTKNVDRGTGVGLSGSGLGLSAAYSIVKQHNGILTVDSVMGDGATVSMYLPVPIPEVLPTGEVPVVRQVSMVKGGVLMLGVEAGAQPFVSSLLDSLGYRARNVFDMTQAMELLGKEPDKWGYLLLDLDGSGPSSFDKITQLLSQYPDRGMVVVSAAPVEAVLPFELSSRVVFLDKPLGVWSMESALNRLKPHHR